MRDVVKAGTEYMVFGKPNLFNGVINIIHPELEPWKDFEENFASGMQSMYNTTEKCKAKFIDSKAILKMQKQVVAQMPQQIGEILSQNIINDAQLMTLKNALVQFHFPDDISQLMKARFRIKFDEFFFLQLRLLKLKLVRTEKNKGHRFEKVGEHFNYFFSNNLPFELTSAQKKVLREIRSDCNTGHQMNRLLQGDVGSGKTLVALMSMILAIDNGYQAALMAPTEILAQQHFVSVTELLGDMPVRVELLTGSTKKAKRELILSQLVNNEIHILIGTHALIEDAVQFKKLGLAVIDEQHRFGVEQRARLWQKNDEHYFPHVLVMTATPIPRTLAMTVYGDLDVSIIDELPPGRKPISTVHRYEKDRLRVFKFMKDEIARGRQIYVVYPLIDESEKLDYMDLMAGFDAIEREFPRPHYYVSIVHGRQKAADREIEMQRFIKGQTQIMVATTVIEVGVNVPNASVMIIESAQRFGLSQLHQLRGRVGRGAEQSYCILMSDYKLSKEAELRIKTMCDTNDGFVIADVDMQLRGPGDIEGTQQSGIVDLKVADITKDGAILERARQFAQHTLQEDAVLQLPQNAGIRSVLKRLAMQRGEWSQVS